MRGRRALNVVGGWSLRGDGRYRHLREVKGSSRWNHLDRRLEDALDLRAADESREGAAGDADEHHTEHPTHDAPGAKLLLALLASCRDIHWAADAERTLLLIRLGETGERGHTGS